MKNKKIWMGSAAAAVLAAVMTAGGIMAYFTDTEEKVNHFTVGSVEITLEEPKWDEKPDEDGDGVPDEAEDLLPVQTVTKDPQITNTGTNDAFVFAVVQVPCRNIVTANTDGTKNPQAMTDLFSYRPGNAWTSLGMYEVTGEDGTVTAHKYLYAYAPLGENCTVVKPGETTQPLFESVTFVNAVEGQGLENAAFDLEISAYGIQTTDLDGGRETPAQVWGILSNQKELPETYQ